MSTAFAPLPCVDTAPLTLTDAADVRLAACAAVVYVHDSANELP